ncbi:MAG: tetratricopeptide repeat protein [Rhodobacterales bacterium]|nr:tetratricopeptide repeat protein [Rhodobacterales bacterium]
MRSVSPATTTPAQAKLASVRGAAVLLALTGLVFAPGLRAGFVYDDRRDILGNPAAQAASFQDQLPETLRPLLKASYALQDALTGFSAPAFHMVNLAMHLGAVLLVLTLVTRVCRLAGHALPMADRIAWIAAGLWAVHPALTDTVTYVSGRSAGLSGLLVLGAIVAATAERPRPLLAFGCAGLAPLARETALVAPLLLVAWQLTLGQEDPRLVALRRAAPVWAGALVAALVIAAMARHRDLVAFSLAQRPPLDALRANVFAIPEILRLWGQPWRVSILPQQPLIHGWNDAPTLLRLTALATLPVLALALRHRAPLAAFAALWTLIALMPTNSLIWRVDPVALRPLYLAGIGLSLLLALMMARLRFGPALALALVAGLGAMTWTRATLYQDEVALFADAAAKAPNDARSHLMLGLVLANAGRLDEAQAALDQALLLDPFQTGAENALRLLKAGAPIARPPAP